MRVLWLSHVVPYPPKGGLTQRSFNLLRETARRHEVRLLALNQPALLPTREEVTTAAGALSEFCTIAGIEELSGGRRFVARPRTALRSLAGSWPYSVRCFWMPEFLERVRHTASQFRPDIIHFDTVGLAPYRRACSGIPALLTHHNIESHMMLRRARLTRNPVVAAYFWQEGRRLERYERKSGPWFNGHIVVSEPDAARLAWVVSPPKTFVVPNGVDTEYFQPGEDLAGEDSGSLVFAGGLTWYPNSSAIRWFVDKIWPEITRTRPDVTFTVIGRNPPRWLRDRAENDRRIHVTGFVPDVRPYLQRAAVYVCPIYDGGGTKLKVLDALAMGKAVVCHPISCEGIDVEDGTHAIMRSAPGEFASAVVSLLADPARRRTLGGNGRARVCERYAFGSIGETLSLAYESIVWSASESCRP